MKYVIEYAKNFDWKSVERIARKDLLIIKKAIEEKLSITPEIFGKPLQHSLKGYRRLRIGAYRAIFIIKGKIVVIIHIGHRSSVYKNHLPSNS